MAITITQSGANVTITQTDRKDINISIYTPTKVTISSDNLYLNIADTISTDVMILEAVQITTINGIDVTAYTINQKAEMLIESVFSPSGGGSEVTIMLDGNPVSNSNPLPVTAPSGSATSANQVLEIAAISDVKTELVGVNSKITTSNTLLGTINTNVGDVEAELVGVNSKLTTSNNLLTTIDADIDAINSKTPVLSGGKVPVTDPTALPLPSGAATSAIQATQQTTLDAINAKTATLVNSNVPVQTQGLSNSGTMAALNSEVLLTVSGMSGVAIDLRGTFSATVTFAGSIDGVNFFNLVATPVASSNNVATVNTATAAGAWFVNCQGCSTVRARATTYTSGTITAVLRATTAPAWLYSAPVGATTAVSGTVTANIGTGSIAAGTNAIGDIGVQFRANATGAASRTHLISAATTNATVVKASAGRIVGWNISNTNAAYRYVKFHNQTTSPTAGTGVVQTVGVPPNSNVNFNLSGGIAFTTGIAMTTVTGAADADTAAVGLNDLIIDIFYA